MAGITQLYDIFKKTPEEVEKLFDTEIEVTEKLDGSRISVEIREGATKIFKKNDSSPITSIDRILSRYYEKAVSHFENFTPEKFKTIPENWRFGFEYFPTLRPVSIAYDRMPLNHLVLTDISVRDGKGRVTEVITDKPTLDEWAEILEVEGPPLIFKGRLSPQQKESILEFLNSSKEDLFKKFKTESFMAFLLKTLDPSISKSFMQNSIDKDIEAIVFRFDGKNPLKVMNPVYELSKSVKEKAKPSDMYGLTLYAFQEFFSTFELRKIKLKSETYEDRYVELISEAFNSFVNSPVYKNNFSGEVEFDLPDFLTREEARENLSLVKNEETRKLLQNSATNRELFKIMLAAMRSHKKKPMGFFKKELVIYHNRLVDKIADFVNAGIKENFFSFDRFREVFLVSENHAEEIYDKVFEVNAIEKTVDISEIPQEEKTAESPAITTLKSLFLPIASSNSKENVVLMYGKFLPFNLGHLTVCKDNLDRGYRTVIVAKYPGYQDISESTLKMSLEKACDENEKHLAGYMLNDTPDYTSLINSLRKKGLRVVEFAGSEDDCKEFDSQLDSRISTNVSQHVMSAKNVHEAIREGNYEKYKKLVPPSQHGMFHRIKSELK
jgi:hypothetical protein